MDRLLTPSRTPIAQQWLQQGDARLGPIRSALLSTVDGHRNVIELESIARAMGLEPTALERLRQLGLIDFAG